MHFLKAIDNAGPYLEFSIEEKIIIPGNRIFLNDPFKIENGNIEIKDIPGWGIEINPDWLKSSEYKISEI